MNRKNLSELLMELAKSDLEEGIDISTHPCALAVRMIDQCFEDVSALREVVRDHHGTHSKKIEHLIRLTYNPKV